MGHDLAEFFEALTSEYVWLFCKMDDWHSLYGAIPGQADLLSKSANQFFSQLDAVYVESIALHICRMTDKERNGYQYVSIHGLPPLILDAGRKIRCHMLVSEEHKAANICRVWRDSLIAHSSRAARLPSGGSQVLRPSWNDLVQIRDTLFSVLRLVHDEHMPSGLASNIIRGGGDAKSIVHHLKASQKFTELRIARFDNRFDVQKWKGWDDVI